MSSYKRAKREDYKKSTKKEMSMYIGSVSDNIDTLKAMCNDEANELIKSVELSYGEEMNIVFWTADFIPELIGIAAITRNNSGLLTYKLDFSQSTI